MSQKDSSKGECSSLESNEFIDALKAQQPWALEQLFDRFEGPVYRFFFYSNRDHDRAQDDCAETFITLISAIKNFTGTEASLTAFIFGIARNIQRHSRRPKAISFESDDNINSIIDPVPSAFNQLCIQRDYQQAIGLLDQFNETARQVMILRYVEELNISDISTALDMPENTIKSHLRRGCLKLRDLMQDTPVKKE